MATNHEADILCYVGPEVNKDLAVAREATEHQQLRSVVFDVIQNMTQLQCMLQRVPVNVGLGR